MNKKIMIVDDNFVSRESLKRLLGDYGDCQAFEKGQDALQAFHLAHAQKRCFSLMTLDISMPGMGGHDVLKIIREWEQAAGIAQQDRLKVIMITAHKQFKEIWSSFEGGCENFIVKPATQEKLDQAMNDLKIFKKSILVPKEADRKIKLPVGKILVINDQETALPLIEMMIELAETALNSCQEVLQEEQLPEALREKQEQAIVSLSKLLAMQTGGFQLISPKQISDEFTVL
ncbi:MAG: hypothetical protein COB67_07650 [SAR324 cluster bacterium]|uniref:Response regulatory domain-containing protein n=1 Tax=SAR324 cluster bacterium TaxID=2024889 RepID=A0A2A4T4C1_9DELT|nr:MAG: hypothetical protein COB67_07650 [SAR324 cluster bacterium]